MQQYPKQKLTNTLATGLLRSIKNRQALFHLVTPQQLVLFLCIVALLLISVVPSLQHPNAYAESTISNMSAGCSWHRVTAGETLDGIAYAYRANIWALARTNSIHNINLIYTGQNLCILHAGRRGTSGLIAGGRVRWYAYNALEHSNRQQIRNLIRSAARRHGLPERLMFAIAWQESGWTQHVIARDGGIGTMQIMPYTAQGLNRQVHGHYDPYKVSDNIELGAIYLRSLWHGFHGNQTLIISAYNEGGWNVQHRGIFNWPYIANVRALMRCY